jgi:hypothetical protein
MIKKILFITFLCLSSAVFSQKTLQELTATPNPFYNTTTIQFSSTVEEPIILIIKNVLGKTVFKKTYSTKIGPNKILFTRDDLQAGIYIYAIQSRKQIISKRFIIK